MNDKNITITIKANASQFQGALGTIKKSLAGINTPAKSADKSIGNLAISAGAVAGVASGLFRSAMNSISSSIGGAVSRVDTLVRFPTVMENMGYSAQEAKNQVNRMAKELEGLPTSLDSLTNFVNRVAPVSGSLKNATDTAIAFNNAVLAGGGPVYRQADAIEQFSQMLSKGVPDQMAWKTLQEAMPATLGQVAKGLGDASGNTQALYEKLSTGEVSFQQFTDEIIRLNENGLPGFKSFSEQAKDATEGIATGGTRMKTAITRGIAEIITAVGQKNISNALGSIGRSFESVAGGIATSIGFIARNKDIFAPIAVGVTTIVGAMTAWYLITKSVAIAQGILNAVMSANPIGIIILAIAGLIAGLTYFFTKTELGKQIFGGFMNFISNVFKVIGSVISGVVDWIKANWPMLLTILLGPIGLAVTFIIKHWDTIKEAFARAWEYIKAVWSGVIGFYAGIWQGIVNIFSSVGNWFGDRFREAWNQITGLFSGIGGFFRGVWNTVTSIFSNVGTAVGNAIGGAVKGVVNSILNGAEDIINGFIRAINGAIGTINRIPGVNIGRLGYLSLPRLATGGIVDATSGGRAITVAEGGQAEWIVPESKMASLVQQINRRLEGNSGTPVQKIHQEFNVTIELSNDGTDFTQSQAESMAKKIVVALKAQGLSLNEIGALR